MDFNYSAKSDIGQVRKINEDSVEAFINNGSMFLIIADGFGINDESSAIPSGILITNEIKNFIIKFNSNDDFIPTLLEQSMYLGNDIIRKYQELNPILYSKYGCSLTICAILSDYRMFISHVGINRLYLIRNEQIFQGTEDHNESYELLKTNKITKEEYETHERRGFLTNGMGYKDDIIPFKTSVQLFPGDFVLLLSDGVYRLLGDERIKNIVFEAGELDTACNWLIEGANLEGGVDNLSAIISHIL